MHNFLSQTVCKFSIYYSEKCFDTSKIIYCMIFDSKKYKNILITSARFSYLPNLYKFLTLEIGTIFSHISWHASSSHLFVCHTYLKNNAFFKNSRG